MLHHCAPGRTELLPWRGKAEGCPECLELTPKDCPDVSTAASRAPLQGVEVLSRCFILSVCGELLSPGHCVGDFAPPLAESLVYLIFNLVLVHLK